MTLETRCSRAQVLSGCWLVPRAAVRAERESPAGPGGVPIQTDPELVSRAVARRPDTLACNVERQREVPCEVRNGSSTGRYRTYP